MGSDSKVCETAIGRACDHRCIVAASESGGLIDWLTNAIIIKFASIIFLLAKIAGLSKASSIGEAEPRKNFKNAGAHN